jgi:two-component system, NtrC family, sensor kinase
MTMEKILVVDDDAPIRKLLQRILEEAGYECRTAESVADALECLETFPCDLILSDIHMPEKSGIELIRQVKAQYPETAVAVVSNMDNPTKTKAVLDLDIYGYIVKPFTRKIVNITVDNALRRHKLELQQKENQQILEALVEKRTIELQDQLSFLQTLMDAIPLPIFYKNPQGVFQGGNTAWERFMGKNIEALVDKTVHDIAPKALADIYHAADLQLMEKGGKQVYEAKVQTADETRREVVFHKAVYMDSRGETAGMVGVMLDITERKAAEEALRASEEKLSLIVENLGVGIATISPDMEILWMSEQMRTWFPETKVAAPPICYRSFTPPARETPCDCCPTIMALKTGERHEAFATIPMPEGTRHFRIISTPIHDRHGKVIAAIELVEDITERISLEQELRHAQKLEAIGQLAAGIAHEINTPIQYIGDNTSFLKEAFEDLNGLLGEHVRLMASVKTDGGHDEEIKKLEDMTAKADLEYLVEEVPHALDQTLEGVQRVSKIVQAMREFSHPGSEQKVAVDLNRALESTITVARNEWKYVAALETDFATDLPTVACLPGEMNQVFLNLIINAAHAIGEASDGGRQGKGRITIATRAEDHSVVIRISDTGAGIPENIQSRIFDPFFTTKTVGKGTGQGLAIAHAVVEEKHGGSLRFESEMGQGTTFSIRLPIGDSADSGESSHA